MQKKSIFSRTSLSFKIVTSLLITGYAFLSLGPTPLFADLVLLSPPQQSIYLSPTSKPPLLKGIRIDPHDLLKIEFILDPGSQEKVSSQDTSRLIQYFLAGLTIPSQDIWVNLSPYEKNRIMNNDLSKTDLGRDLLMGDYVLKQLSAALTDPRRPLGKSFWEATQGAGDNTHKVWITPEKANVVSTDHGAFIESATLNVLTDKDYLAYRQAGLASKNKISTATNNDIFKKLILPKIKRDVNQGANFDRVRQIYHALILGLWFKQRLQHSIFQDVYFDQKRIKGIDLKDVQIKEKIYQQYLQAFKKGVYNYIQEDLDVRTQTMVPRHYFSGGFELGKPSVWLNMTTWDAISKPLDAAMLHLSSVNVMLEQMSKPKRWLSTATVAVSMALGSTALMSTHTEAAPRSSMVTGTSAIAPASTASSQPVQKIEPPREIDNSYDIRPVPEVTAWDKFKHGFTAVSDVLLSVPCLLMIFIVVDMIKKRNRKDVSETEGFLNAFSAYLNDMASKEWGFKKNNNAFSGLSKLAFTSAQRLGDGRIQMVFQTSELLPREMRNGKSDLFNLFSRKDGILSNALTLKLSSNGDTFVLDGQHLNSVEMLKTGFVLAFNPPAGSIPHDDEFLSVHYAFDAHGQGDLDIGLTQDPLRGVVVEWEEVLNTFNKNSVVDAIKPLRSVIQKFYALQEKGKWLSFTDIVQDSAVSGKMSMLVEQTNELLANTEGAERTFFLRLKQHLHWDQRLRDQVTVLYRDKNRDLVQGDPLGIKLLFFIKDYPLDKLLRITYLKEYFRNKAIQKAKRDIMLEYYKTRYAVYALSQKASVKEVAPINGFNITLEQLNRQFDDYVYKLEKVDALGSVGRNPSERHNRVIRSSILFGTFVTTSVLWGMGLVDYWLILGQAVYLSTTFFTIPWATKFWLNRKANAYTTDQFLRLPPSVNTPAAKEERQERHFLSTLRNQYWAKILKPRALRSLGFVRAFTSFIDITSEQVDGNTVRVNLRTDGYISFSKKTAEQLKNALGEHVRVFIDNKEVTFRQMNIEVGHHDVTIVLKHPVQKKSQLKIQYDAVEGGNVTTSELVKDIVLNEEESLMALWKATNAKPTVQNLTTLFYQLSQYLSTHPLDILNAQQNAISYHKMRALAYDTIKALKMNVNELRRELPQGGYEFFLSYFVCFSLLSNKIREGSANLVTMHTYSSRFFHESTPYGGMLGRLQRPLMGVYYHYLKAKDNMDDILKNIVIYKKNIALIEQRGYAIFKFPSFETQGGIDYQKMHGKVAAYDHAIRHPRKYSQVGATVVRSMQRMVGMSVVLTLTMLNILFFPIVDMFIAMVGALPTQAMYTIQNIRQGVGMHVFQNLGVGDIFMYLALLSPWIIYMHAQMNTQWESFAYQKSLENLLKNKWGQAKLWNSHFFQNVYKASYFTALAFSFKITLGLNFLQSLYTGIDARKKKKLKKNALTKREPTMKGKPNLTVIKGLKDGDNAKNVGGIDMDIAKFGIDVNATSPTQQPIPLKIERQDFEGFRFRILNLSPMTTPLQDFLKP